MDLCNDLSCELEVGCHTGVFNQRFEALFSSAGALGCVVCLTKQLFFSVYPHGNVGLSGRQLPRVLSPRLPVSTPPTGLDECFFFSSLTPWLSDFHTVRFSGCSGCFLFLNLLSFFWLYEEAQCVYLRLHLGQMSPASSSLSIQCINVS